MSIEQKELLVLKEVAEKAAVQAGDLAEAKWLEPRQLTIKGFRDIVTEVDVEAQRLITDMIRERFPDHGFLTEESDSELPSDGTVTWVIDPIDGTTNFSRSVPDFCVSIAAVVEESRSRDRVLAGVIYDPMRGELFSAASGLGSELNGRPIRVSETEGFGQAIVGLDWSRNEALRQAAYESVGHFLHQVHTVRAIGSAALALAWVAAGRFDAYMNYSLYPWDVRAGELLISEAGGDLSDMEGRNWCSEFSEGSCIASNGRIHQAFLAMVVGKGDE